MVCAGRVVDFEMSAATGEPLSDLEVRERLARIDQLTADAALKRQEFDIGILKFWVSAVGAAAALLGAGAALGALITKALT